MTWHPNLSELADFCEAFAGAIQERPMTTLREAHQEVEEKLRDVLDILRPIREHLDAQGYRALVTAHDDDGRITLTVEVTTVKVDKV